MRTLHVAALPFPSPQGTQALLHAMLVALQDAGHETHLLCYPHGAGELAAPYRLHRAGLASRAYSLRSGPSLAKLWLDFGLLQRLRELHDALRPDAVIAHHVEAAGCALALRIPYVFVAHTSLRHELPTYGATRMARALRAVGGAIDRRLTRGAAVALAVSPLLAMLLSREASREVEPIALPWTVPPAIAPRERALARRELALAQDAPVLLYAGNLDGYQGIESMLPGMRRVFATSPRARWLVATPQAPAELRELLAIHELTQRTSFAPLASEVDRRRVHAAADLVLVPRRAAGGLPIKLLDALARAVPVVAARLALAGHRFDPLCEVVDEAGTEAWSAAILRVLARPREARERAERARAEVASMFDRRLFVAALRHAAQARAR